MISISLDIDPIDNKIFDKFLFEFNSCKRICYNLFRSNNNLRKKIQCFSLCLTHRD